ncbi:MAG: hypothetical protein ACI9LO_002057 [Planctomycetota bacterium]|jgi:hypothetical protein
MWDSEPAMNDLIELNNTPHFVVTLRKRVAKAGGLSAAIAQHLLSVAREVLRPLALRCFLRLDLNLFSSQSDAVRFQQRLPGNKFYESMR